VHRISVALDPLPEVVDAACAANIDLLITHHPLTLTAHKTIDFGAPFGRIVQQAARNNLAIFAAHTNLDSAHEGLNDLLASRLGLKRLACLQSAQIPNEYKLVVYAPVEHEQIVLQALFEAGAGQIGAYTNCSFRNRGTGTFKPGSETQPYKGTPGSLSQVDEVRIEAVVGKGRLPQVVKHVRDRHPYETMAYDVYPLLDVESTQGLGCVGEFEDVFELRELALMIKAQMNLAAVRVVGRPDLSVRRAAICSGSGASLLPFFWDTDAQVFISGDWRYHDARQVEAGDRGLIDIGHYASEHIVVRDLVARLQKMMAQTNLAVVIEACEVERDPFYIL